MFGGSVMIFKARKLDEPGITFHALNVALGCIGLGIIWLSTHSWVGVLGGVVAAIHVRILCKAP
jgi:hypothetical protein